MIQRCTHSDRLHDEPIVVGSTKRDKQFSRLAWARHLHETYIRNVFGIVWGHGWPGGVM